MKDQHNLGHRTHT